MSCGSIEWQYGQRPISMAGYLPSNTFATWLNGESHFGGRNESAEARTRWL